MSSLAVLNSVAANAVALQVQDPARFVARDSSLRTRVAGIDVVDQQKLDERVLRLENYQADAAMLRKRLDAAKVTYLAVLPKTAWSHLATESNLFRFKPDVDGGVPVESSLLDRVGVSALRTLGMRCLLALAAGASAGIALALAATMTFQLALWAGIVLTLLCGVIGAYGAGRAVRVRYYAGDAPDPAAIMRLEKAQIRKALSVPRSTLLRMLWPQDFVPGPSSVRLGISLPPAPADAQANLMRASKAKLPLTLYAVDEAIQFDEEPATAFFRAREPHWHSTKKAHAAAIAAAELERRHRAEMNARYWDNLLHDPIVTVDLESATAIIVQYGDFPIEREVIERVFDSERLI